MKRSCETCLWWDWDGDTHTDQRRGNCRHSDPPTHFLPAAWLLTIATDWCYKWEPRDRSLVRCETCEWYEGGRCHRHLIKEIVGTTTGLNGAVVTKGFRCSHWRLREERDDGE